VRGLSFERDLLALYAHVAPVSWFVIDPMNHGRSHLNFQSGELRRVGTKRPAWRDLQGGEERFNALSSYTPLHPGAKLSAEDIKELCYLSNQARAGLR
jgi:hypothetical protein